MIHYHTDLTKYWDELINVDFITKNNDWIIEELKTWNTAKEYNHNCVCRLNSRCWCQFQSSKKTMEVRIGEMTFDYSIISKRAIHCNSIVRKLVKENKKEYLITIKDKLAQLNNELLELKQEQDLNKDIQIMKNRIIKI